MKSQAHYQTYILRLWQMENAGQPVAFATLEDCQTNQRQVFSSLAALSAFLQSRVEEDPTLAAMLELNPPPAPQ